MAIERYNRLPAEALKTIFIARCRDYQQQPPVAEWDGVYTMIDK